MLKDAITFPLIRELPMGAIWITAGAAVAAVSGAMVLFAFEPEESGWFPPCPFHATTGLQCPGCGALRGLHQLLHGNLMGALDFNPLMVLALPFIGYAVMCSIVFEISGRRLPSKRIPPQAIWGLLGLIIAFWIVRNIPMYPLSLLAS